MSANKPVQNALEELKGLRDSFAESAAKSEKTARDLEDQARRAREAARSQRERTRVIEEAIALLLENQNDESATVDIDGLGKKAAAKIGTRRFVFMIDGSGSMNGRPLDNSLKAGTAIRDKMEEKSGKAPSLDAVLFGDRNPVALDLSDAQAVEMARRGLNCGTDLAPSIEKLADQLAGGKTCHAVIISDGDLFDHEKSREALKKLLQDNPKATVDFVIISSRSGSYPAASWGEKYGSYYPAFAPRTNTQMQSLAEGLASELPESRRPKVACTQAEDVAATVSQLLAQRLNETKPRKPKNPAPGK